MRSLVKLWKNSGPAGRRVPFTARIRWLDDGPEDIRLELQDSERMQSVYPDSKEDADKIWDLFVLGAPEPGHSQAFIGDLLKIAKQGGVQFR